MTASQQRPTTATRSSSAICSRDSAAIDASSSVGSPASAAIRSRSFEARMALGLERRRGNPVLKAGCGCQTTPRPPCTPARCGGHGHWRTLAAVMATWAASSPRPTRLSRAVPRVLASMETYCQKPGVMGSACFEQPRRPPRGGTRRCGRGGEHPRVERRRIALVNRHRLPRHQHQGEAGGRGVERQVERPVIAAIDAGVGRRCAGEIEQDGFPVIDHRVTKGGRQQLPRRRTQKIGVPQSPAVQPRPRARACGPPPTESLVDQRLDIPGVDGMRGRCSAQVHDGAEGAVGRHHSLETKQVGPSNQLVGVQQRVAVNGLGVLGPRLLETGCSAAALRSRRPAPWPPTQCRPRLWMRPPAAVGRSPLQCGWLKPTIPRSITTRPVTDAPNETAALPMAPTAAIAVSATTPIR